MKLFDIEPTPPSGERCGDCVHIERRACNSKYFHYCSVRKSGRTSNGLLKVKCKSEACMNFKSKI